jgi:hypothetical protein
MTKMAHIKEPEGVDFVIQSPPLTDEERKEISELIKKMKARNSRTISREKKARREMAD